ncbi:MAG: hypothetical protein ACOCPX_04130 [Halapricum sp.]
MTGLAGASFVLAGCSGGSDDTTSGETTTEPQTETDTPTTTSMPDPTPTPEPTPTPTQTEIPFETVLDDTRQVNEDQYWATSLEPDQDLEVEMEMVVREGPAVDVFVATAQEFQYYENGERFQVVDDLSFKGSEGGTRSGVLEAGEYALVIDNKDGGWAEPPTNFDDDLARVDLTIRARST